MGFLGRPCGFASFAGLPEPLLAQKEAAPPWRPSRQAGPPHPPTSDPPPTLGKLKSNFLGQPRRCADPFPSSRPVPSPHPGWPPTAQRGEPSLPRFLPTPAPETHSRRHSRREAHMSSLEHQSGGLAAGSYRTVNCPHPERNPERRSSGTRARPAARSPSTPAPPFPTPTPSRTERQQTAAQYRQPKRGRPWPRQHHQQLEYPLSD
ncbi:uncharacterized protein LOC143679262 [Tamandua tetradactyla]|uniref:uncharacterized protein LOC143679262 n=1 Tax=Tamandua tetradactyla TaxID=48850 RepID=UPI00405407BF